MKKSIICLSILSLFTIHLTSAQEFNTGTNVINAGIGIGSSLSVYSGASESIGYGIFYERGIWDVPGPGVVSLGGYLGYKSFKYNRSSYKLNYTIIGVRSAYHYNGFKIDNLDLYAGAMVSYNIVSDSYSGNSFNSYNSAAGVSGFAGARWYFTKNIAVFIEAGYGVSFLNTGISFRF
ncbi:hypothetical protein Q4Q34_08840 [Flavivirga abyssicola]|uniref:hypothetical protein n=1 Tax=Flavivirga abyssicola TaxID=3063533 RepID=UPI0026E101D9|nr:hypothetical protein [Flavivirga sp. MEBiC07777]WVK15133.1 hypothetical protein Q4Q34_08840 [Flavivirga sp. MEBiC07777]